MAAKCVLNEAVLEAFDLYPVPAEGCAFQPDFHVRLTDQTRGAVIRWAIRRCLDVTTMAAPSSHASGLLSSERCATASGTDQ